jgi:GNAT superfamily N-acetyltransferase
MMSNQPTGFHHRSPTPIIGNTDWTPHAPLITLHYIPEVTRMPTWRLATLNDVPAIDALITESARSLCGSDYTPAQIEAALGTAWGCDTELIRDGTYYVAEEDGAIVACGGWGKRRTLFGSDRRPDRDSDLLDPARDAARIRAFFVHPAWARHGLGRELLARCEAEARAHGFRTAALMATLSGRQLYLNSGYTEDEAVDYPLPAGETIRFIPMRKSLG